MRLCARFGSPFQCCQVHRLARSPASCRLAAHAAMAPAAQMHIQALAGVSISPDTVAAMLKAYVREGIPEAHQVSITMCVDGKTINMSRDKSELLSKTFARLRKNLEKASTKPKRNKKQRPGSAPGSIAALEAEPAEELPIVLFEDIQCSRPISQESVNGIAWREAEVIRIGDQQFEVLFNPPSVLKLTLMKRAIMGYPLLPRSTMVYAEDASSQWVWSRRRAGNVIPPSSTRTSSRNSTNTASGTSDGHGSGPVVSGVAAAQQSVSSAGGVLWEVVGSGMCYTPSEGDVGHVLRVQCNPGIMHVPQRDHLAAHSENSGELVSVSRNDSSRLWLGEPAFAETGIVEAAPAVSAASHRCVHTPHATSSPGLRVLSYNILADQYAGSDYAQNVLFSYCPRQFLEPDYRKQLVLQEVLGYHADVMCLQEVDSERAFADYLLPHLRRAGYEGHYTNKMGKVREGSAMFWKTSRFRLLATRDIRLREVFAAGAVPSFQPMLEASPELASVLQKVTTVAQAVLLQPVGSAHSEEGCLCVVNTHLFFHPYAPHIRTLHTAAIMHEAAALLTAAASGQSDAMVAPASGAAAPVAGGLPDLAQTHDGQVSSKAKETLSVSAALAARPPSLLFCGDLNSDLNDGIPGTIELLRSGKVASDHWDWVQGAPFKWGMGEEDGEAVAAAAQQLASTVTKSTSSPTNTVQHSATTVPSASLTPPAADTQHAAADAHSTQIDAGSAHAMAARPADLDGPADAPQHSIAVTGPDLTIPFQLRSADNLTTPYTNYTSGYKALLDYIWYEPSRLEVVSAVPMPTEETLKGYIPSEVFPSDHLAVVYDLRWRPCM